MCCLKKTNKQCKSSFVSLLLVSASAHSCVLTGCYLICFSEPVRQQSAELSFTETKMSEQHFRCMTEPELSRFRSLSFKRLQLLTKFSATGNLLGSFLFLPASPAPRLALSSVFKVNFFLPCFLFYADYFLCLKALLLQLN